MSYDLGGGSAGPQQPYSTDPLPHDNRMSLGNSRSASLVAVVLGVVGVVLIIVTSVGWVAVTCGLVAIVAGLIGRLGRPGRDKGLSWAGIALGVATVVLSVSI